MKRYIANISSWMMFIALGVLAVWVIFLLQHQILGYKIFKENLYQTSLLITFGLLSLIAGAFLVNVSINISRVADSSESISEKGSIKRVQYALAGFVAVVILTTLMAGFLNYKSNEWIRIKIHKEYKDLYSRYKNTMNEILKNAARPSKWEKVYKRLEFLQSRKNEFRNIYLIYFEPYDGHITYKYINYDYSYKYNKKVYSLDDYRCSKKECDVLEKVYNETLEKEELLETDDNHYILIAPIYASKNYALVLTRFQKYGKI